MWFKRCRLYSKIWVLRVVSCERRKNRRSSTKIVNPRTTERCSVKTHFRNSFEDIVGNRFDFLGGGIRLRQGHQFINNFELEPREDRLSADKGGHNMNGLTVIDLPS
jgi:hypothetical protein